jgi:hypothetical protein
MKKIFQLFKASKKYSIKWSNYFEIYEKTLKKYINKKITLVEVGVGDGGSLFMWKKFLGKKANVIGIELNPEAKKLEKFGFKIFNGDQSSPDFWKDFYKKVGKIDVLIDDGGHTNLQQITTFMESLPHVRDGGVIIVEDTHTSYMNYKGFKNPSNNSFINFSNKLIENIHRRNPMLRKKINQFSKKIYSIEYYDSIVCINVNKEKFKISQNLENNKKLRNFFTDYRFKKINMNNSKINQNWILKKIFSIISKKGTIHRIYENYRINKYINKISN